MNYFANELKEEWALMRQGRFTLDNLMKYVIENQIEVIPAKYYNDDAQVKYIAFGSKYTYCCHGNKELLVKRWLRERIAYVDSMMGYFTSQDDQVTIRMNKTGYVEFTVTPYIPLYFSVKWSNAAGGIQTFKLKRGETKTFYYTSTTATDQEIIIYHAQYIKELGNLSNLRPSSCILANAYKLNNVEIHSEKLYNINVTSNRYLRQLNLSGCSMLGTVTATGSVLDVSQCKYLSYVNVYGTALTGVLLDTSGGSLKEIYYPKTIQQVQLIKQRLLEKVGLPYGNNGADIPTSLYTVDIQECPNIKILNTSQNSAINKTWISMKYCQNLTVRNSLDFEKITLDGFQRLKVLKLENMFKLKSLGFDDMLVKGEASTLQYMGISYCPELTDITMNCTSNKYEITFADGALLNLSGASNLNSISSNCVIKGLETIVLPLTVKHLYFTNEYGTGYSSIKNIWSSRCCEINEEGVLPIAIRYEDKDFIGMDLQGMKLNDIDLGALVNIPAAINFDLAPTSINPNFNINRDGVEYPYLQPQGLLDLSNYTESLARFFNGVDLDKLEIIVNNPLPQTDLSYCFYNSTFSNEALLMPILNNVSNINNLDYCFYKTIISDISILNHINMGDNSSMNYTFAECENITNLEDITIPRSVVSVEGMFYKCPLTSIRNMTVNVQGSIKGLFKGCSELTTIETFNTPNVTDVSSLFEGCEKLSVLTGFELPTSCTNIDNLFNGCVLLTRLSLNFGRNIVYANNWFPPNLQELYDITINNSYVKMKDCTTLKRVNNLTLDGANFSDMFNGCINLEALSMTLGNATGLSSFLKGCAKINTIPFLNIPNAVANIDYIFNGTNITDISGLVIGTGVTSAENWYPQNLRTANNVIIKNNIINFTNNKTLQYAKNLSRPNSNNWDNFFKGCTELKEDIIFPSNTVSVVNCFNGCTSMTHIHSNWENEYENEITATDCYTGCTGITHRDGLDLGVNKYIKGLDDVPPSWGGYGLHSDYTTICVMNIPSDNFEMVLNNNSYAVMFDDKVIEWGDGAVTYGTNRHTYAKAGDYVIRGKYWFDNVNLTWARNIRQLIKGPYGVPVSGFFTFVASSLLTYANISNMILSNTSSMFNMYQAATAGGPYLTEIVIKNTRILKDSPMNNFFSNNKAPTQIDVGGFVLEGGHTCANMFRGCTNLTTINGTGTFDWTKVTDISNMFYSTAITTVPSGMENADLSSATNISSVFNYCSQLETADLSGWKTSSKATSLYAMFHMCKKLKSVKLGSIIKSSITDLSQMFVNDSLLETVDVTGCDTSGVTTMNSMFSGCTSLTDCSFLEKSDLSEITNMENTFNGTSISDFSFLNTLNVAKVRTIHSMLANNKKIISITCPDWFKLSTMTTTSSLFSGCSNLKEIRNFDWGTHFSLSGSTSMYPSSVFSGCTSLETIEDVNMNYTSILGTQHGGNGVNNDYWTLLAWELFQSLPKLKNINFTGTVTLYSTVSELRFFVNCEVRDFTLQTWQSFVDTLPFTNDSHTIRVNKGLATIPDSIVSQITNKGYTLTT